MFFVFRFTFFAFRFSFYVFPSSTNNNNALCGIGKHSQVVSLFSNFTQNFRGVIPSGHYDPPGGNFEWSL